MGYDWGTTRPKRRTGRTAPGGKNPYLALLVKLYRFLASKTGLKYNRTVLKRLFMSKGNKPPVSLSNLSKHMKYHGDQIAVVVGKVVDDPRLLEVPKITVAALTVSHTARARILKAGGKILTLDQLALRSPRGEDTYLMKGVSRNRRVVRHYGVPGAVGSKVIPKVQAEGRKFEKARGRRASRGFKV